MGTAILISIVLVVVIILLFVGCKWLKPESLRLKVWNWLEFKMRNRVAQARHQALVILILRRGASAYSPAR